MSRDTEQPGPKSCAAYFTLAMAQLPRLLSSGDREEPSLTYGCFDRSFWAWKFTDFAGARFQEAAYALAHLYRAHTPNPLCGHPKARAWTLASMTFWRRLQHRDGSFDEAYPFEHSLAATAFTSFYVGEAFQLIGDELSSSQRNDLRATFARAGDWLCRNDEYHGVLSNHLAAAAAALVVIERITGEHRFGARVEHFLDRIFDRQSAEGWYEEYGGADPGYQTHCTFYLARIWQLTGDARILDSLTRSVRFLKHFVHPNGTLGGEYGSRNTEFYFPAGFEMLAKSCDDAADVACFMRSGVSSSSAGLPMMDRYNLLPMFNNYLFAEAALAEGRPPTRPPSPLPCEQEGEWHFPDAGLLVRATPAYFAVIGLSKGGVIKLYDRSTRGMVASDCGYWVRLARGAVVSSQSLARPARYRRDAHKLEIDVDFVEVNQRVMSPWLFVAFRLFSLTLGRLQGFADRVKRILVQTLVRRRRTVPIMLCRKIALEPARVCVEDTISNPSGLSLASIAPGEKFATIHMGSSRYFQQQELSAGKIESLDETSDGAQRSFTRSHTWSFD